MPTLTEQQLLEFGTALLAAGGAAPSEAAIVGSSLIGANLRGHDSHGVMRIPFYVQQVQEGRLKSGAELSIVNETSANIVADGSWGFGQVLSRQLMEKLIVKASEVGIASTTATGRRCLRWPASWVSRRQPFDRNVKSSDLR